MITALCGSLTEWVLRCLRQDPHGGHFHVLRLLSGAAGQLSTPLTSRLSRWAWSSHVSVEDMAGAQGGTGTCSSHWKLGDQCATCALTPEWSQPFHLGSSSTSRFGPTVVCLLRATGAGNSGKLAWSSRVWKCRSQHHAAGSVAAVAWGSMPQDCVTFAVLGSVPELSPLGGPQNALLWPTVCLLSQTCALPE